MPLGSEWNRREWEKKFRIHQLNRIYKGLFLYRAPKEYFYQSPWPSLNQYYCSGTKPTNELVSKLLHDNEIIVSYWSYFLPKTRWWEISTIRVNVALNSYLSLRMRKECHSLTMQKIHLLYFCGVYSASWGQLRSYLNEKVAAPV
jgi:hypothetical protein